MHKCQADILHSGLVGGESGGDSGDKAEQDNVDLHGKCGGGLMSEEWCEEEIGNV